MRLHHFEGHDDDGLFIDLDHVRTICEDGTREGYAIVHTDRTAFLVKGDYQEIAKLVMGEAPEAKPRPAPLLYSFPAPGVAGGFIEVDLTEVKGAGASPFSPDEACLGFKDGRPSLIVSMNVYEVAKILRQQGVS